MGALRAHRGSRQSSRQGGLIRPDQDHLGGLGTFLFFFWGAGGIFWLFWLPLALPGFPWPSLALVRPDQDHLGGLDSFQTSPN